jgi:hypothetical protein
MNNKDEKKKLETLGICILLPKHKKILRWGINSCESDLQLIMTIAG